MVRYNSPDDLPEAHRAAAARAYAEQTGQPSPEPVVYRQDPIRGIEGVAKITRPRRVRRQTAAEVRLSRVWPGTLPYHVEFDIDPDSVLVHIGVDGEPVVKDRHRTATRILGTGSMVAGRPVSGRLYVAQHQYYEEPTPAATKMWAGAFEANRTHLAPWAGQVGMLAQFHTARKLMAKKDADNLMKLVCDAGNGIVYVDDCQVLDPHLKVVILSGRPHTQVMFWALDHDPRGGARVDGIFEQKER